MPGPFPLFPLNAVLVPGLVLPLHIFEPRYRRLVEDLLARPDEDSREFGIVGVREGRSVEVDGVDALWPVGTTALLRQAERLDDGRFDIVTTGSRRFRVLALDTAEPLVRAEVEFLDDVIGPEDAVLAAQVGRRFAAYRLALGGQVVAEEDVPDDSADELPEDPAVLSYLVTAAMVLPAAERQDLLAADTVAERLRRARSLLLRETGLITTLGALPAIDLPAGPGSVN